MAKLLNERDENEVVWPWEREEGEVEKRGSLLKMGRTNNSEW
jgi:hypothetical protein